MLDGIIVLQLQTPSQLHTLNLVTVIVDDGFFSGLLIQCYNVMGMKNMPYRCLLL